MSFVNSQTAKLVVIVVANIKKFRPQFYYELAENLRTDGINLKVIYSEPSQLEAKKNDFTDLNDPIGIKVRRLYFMKGKILLQNFPIKLLYKADLIITVQANGYLLNYLLMLLNIVKIKKVAFWGHGFNHQSIKTTFREKFKRSIASLPYWWFTYTVPTKKYLESIGFSSDKITVIENAIDTKSFANAVLTVTSEEKFKLKNELGFSQESFVAIYCGSLYPDKELMFLIASGKELNKRFSNFKMIIIGDGPDKTYIQEEEKNNSWLKYCGPKFGSEKAKYFAISSVFLNPGLVGLAILDSFAAGLPFIATNYKGHSPEIAYLEENVNGCRFPFNLQSYVDGVSSIINDKNCLLKMQFAAKKSANYFSLTNMVNNVYKGICECLKNK